MKFSFAVLTILGFSSLAIFGFLAMNHGNGHNGCIAAVSQGGVCPNGNRILDFASFHLKAFKKFSSAIIAAFLIVVFGIATFLNLFKELKTVFSSFIVSRLLYFFSPLKRNLIYWLSLHENSPSVV